MPSTVVAATRKVAVDSSALVALFDGSDRHHARALKFFEGVRADLVTNIAVLTEVSHLLAFSHGAVSDCLGWVASSFSIDRDTGSDVRLIIAIMEKYAELPADFADAALVAMCQRMAIDSIATFDSDFDDYRLSSGKALVNVLSGA